MLSSLLSITLLAAAAAVHPGPAKPLVRAALIIRPLTPTTVIISATPATITFTASNPVTAPLVTGNSPAAVRWSYNGSKDFTWDLKVSGGPTAFAGCTTVPLLAVTATCNSVSVTGGGTGAGTCSGPLQLSTTPTKVANGTESGNAVTYQVNLTFTLADSWKYIATTGQTCSLILTYDATLQ